MTAYNATWWDRRFAEQRGLEVRFAEPMGRHTTLGLGGEADIYVVPADEDSLKHLVTVLSREETPITLVGGGSNLLVQDDGIEGVVVSLRRLVRLEDRLHGRDSRRILAGAGVSLAKLLRFNAEKGYTGLEWASGIPGLLGGAIRMNAGAFGFEIKDSLESVWIMDRSGNIAKKPSAEIPFAYRTSGLRDDSLILAAEISVGLAEPVDVLNRVSLYLEEKRQRQPVSDRSAGSVFKNPSGLSAWELIDRAGLRGAAEGGIRVSERHANFFVNDGTGTAEQFMTLLHRVVHEVEDRTGVKLEPEVRILGRKRSIHV